MDDIPPLKRLVPLAIQHVLAMYAGAVAVPLIVGGAMVSAGQLEPSDIVHLIMADPLVAGCCWVCYPRWPRSSRAFRWFQTIFHSGISAGALIAIVLNLLLNSRTRGTDDEPAESGLAASDAPRGALAEEQPELRTIIVTNPSTDRETCAWIHEQGEPQVAAICEKWDDATGGRSSKRGRE